MSAPLSERDAWYRAQYAKGCGDPKCKTHRENKYLSAPTKPATVSEHFRNVARDRFGRILKEVPTEPGYDPAARLEADLFLLAVELEAAYWMGRQDEWRVQSEKCPGADDDAPYRGLEKP